MQFNTYCGYDDFMKQLGDNIRVARKVVDHTQARVAAEIGVTEMTIRSIERGKHITIERLYQLARLFNVSVIDLIPSQNKQK